MVILFSTFSCRKDDPDILLGAEFGDSISVDYGGKTYKARFYDQWWMVENLAWLPSVSPHTAESVTDPVYYVYDYEGTSVVAAKATDNYKTYGVLYNWAAPRLPGPGWFPAMKTACAAIPIGHTPTACQSAASSQNRWV